MSRYRIVILFLFFTVVCQTTAAQYASEKELVSKIRSYTTDASLNVFLTKEGFVSGSEQLPFHVSLLKIDVFRKNLFGTTANEIVVQLREEHNYAVAIYYYESGKLKKVPGRLCSYYEGYGDMEYTFSFESIFKENEFCILVHNYYEPGVSRIITERIDICRITKDTIDNIYGYDRMHSWAPDPFSRSYDYSTDDTLLLLHNSYPKVLILNRKSNRLEGNGIEYSESEDGDGYEIFGTETDTIYFTGDGKYKKVSDSESKTFYYVGRMELLYDFPTIDQYYLDTLIYITRSFANTYLKDPNAPFIKIDTSARGFAICGNAYIKNNKLYLIYKDRRTKQISKASYAINPSISTLIKSEVSVSELCYNISDQKIIALNAEKQRQLRQSYIDLFSFNDNNYVYELDRIERKIIIRSIYEEYYIDFNMLEPYLKPEVVTFFKN